MLPRISWDQKNVIAVSFQKFALFHYINIFGQCGNNCKNSKNITKIFHLQDFCNVFVLELFIFQKGYIMRIQILVTVFVMLMTLTTSSYAKPGDLDTSFGNNGRVTTDFGSYGKAYGMAIQRDGKMVLTGYSNDNYANYFATARYNSDGTLDSSFGGGGIVTTFFGSGGFDDRAKSVAIQNDGKIVVAGYSLIMDNTHISNLAIVRYNSDGSLDSSFGGGGKVETDIGYDGGAHSVAIQNDGKIVAVGDSYDGKNWYYAIVRYNSDGSLDNTFGSGGKVITAIGSKNDHAESVAIQNYGKIVAAGYSYSSSSKWDFAIVRYHSDGTLDSTFSNDGKVTTDIGSDWDRAYSVAIQNDGKIVAAGYNNNSGNYDFTIVRYNSNGSLDNTFSDDGIVMTAIGSSYEEAYSVAIQNNGKIVAAGRSKNSGNDDFAVVRYNSDGSLDNTFGSDGKVTTDTGSNGDRAHSVAIQKDGKIMVAGYNKYGSGNSDFALVRYLGDPTDTSDIIDLYMSGVLPGIVNKK